MKEAFGGVGGSGTDASTMEMCVPAASTLALDTHVPLRLQREQLAGPDTAADTAACAPQRGGGDERQRGERVGAEGAAGRGEA